MIKLLPIINEIKIGILPEQVLKLIIKIQRNDYDFFTFSNICRKYGWYEFKGEFQSAKEEFIVWIESLNIKQLQNLYKDLLNFEKEDLQEIRIDLSKIKVSPYGKIIYIGKEKVNYYGSFENQNLEVPFKKYNKIPMACQSFKKLLDKKRVKYTLLDEDNVIVFIIPHLEITIVND